MANDGPTVTAEATIGFPPLTFVTDHGSDAAFERLDTDIIERQSAVWDRASSTPLPPTGPRFDA